MNPVFNHDVKEERYGDLWPRAICRIGMANPMSLCGPILEVQEDDSYKSVKDAEVVEGSMPEVILYDVHFWGKIQNKHNKLESRPFTKGGKDVFRVDMTDPDAIRQWETAGDSYHAAVVAVCQWHFKTKV